MKIKVDIIKIKEIEVDDKFNSVFSANQDEKLYNELADEIKKQIGLIYGWDLPDDEQDYNRILSTEGVISGVYRSSDNEAVMEW